MAPTARNLRYATFVDNNLIIGIGMSVVGSAIRYLLPSTPRPLAWAALSFGLVFLAAGASTPYINIPIGWLWSGAAIASLLAALTSHFWPRTIEKPKEAALTVQKDDRNRIGDIHANIGTHNQIGQIGHTINQAPEPELTHTAPVTTTHPDGTFTISFLVEVISPYPVGQLYLEVHSDGIMSLDVVPQRTGMSMSGHTGKREGWCFTTLMQAFGRYSVTVRTRENKINMTYAFN